MKRSGAPVLLIAVAWMTAVGCGTATVSADPTRPTTRDSPARLTKVVEGVGFRTDVPGGWVVRHSKDAGIDSYHVTPSKSSGPSDGAFDVTRLPFSAVPTSATPGLDLAHDPVVDLLPKIVGLQKQATNVVVTVEPHDLILASESAASVTMTYDEGGVHLTGQSTLVRHGTALYVLGVTSSSASFLSVLANFEQSEDRIIWM
jgi:hypothetical protein